jgi:hypothetical protein
MRQRTIRFTVDEGCIKCKLLPLDYGTGVKRASGLARRGEKKGAALLLKCDKLRRERMGSVGKPCIIRIIRLFLTLLIP